MVLDAVMLDLETLGTGPYAVIAQIGACHFDSTTGDVGACFSVNVDAADCLRQGFEMSAGTVYWWLKQSCGARESFMENRQDLGEALRRFNTFLVLVGSSNGLPVWSHATFDFNIVQNAYAKMGIKSKMHYRQGLDIRTLEQLSGLFLRDQERQNEAHIALNDCRHQVSFVVKCLAYLRGVSVVVP